MFRYPEESGLRPKPNASPKQQQCKLSVEDGAPQKDPGKCRCLIGRLLYLTITRPDITYVVHILTQFMQGRRTRHWGTALRIIRYIKGSPNRILLPKSILNLNLVSYYDSD